MADIAHPEALADRVAAIDWYHTIELAPGVRTPGWFDHEAILGEIPLPASLNGRRCLDVGTFNGYWAFLMERRGGDVTAVDVIEPSAWDWPALSDPEVIAQIGARYADADGFELARAALGSGVRRLPVSVYDLDPAEIGRFDVVYVGSLLVHLRDPVRALERVRSVCSGSLVLVDGIDLSLTLRHPRLPVARFDGAGRPWWWTANLSGLARIVEAAGFRLTARPRRLFVPPGAGWNPNRWAWRAARHRAGREALVGAWCGDAHGVIVAEPRDR